MRRWHEVEAVAARFLKFPKAGLHAWFQPRFNGANDVHVWMLEGITVRRIRRIELQQPLLIAGIRHEIEKCSFMVDEAGRIERRMQRHHRSGKMASKFNVRYAPAADSPHQ